MEILIISALSIVLIFFAFITGLHYGSKVKKDEVINIPSPTNVIKEYKENKKLEEEKRIEEINLTNIENYDGTGTGQLRFPEK